MEFRTLVFACEGIRRKKSDGYGFGRGRMIPLWCLWGQGSTGRWLGKALSPGQVMFLCIGMKRLIQSRAQRMIVTTSFTIDTLDMSLNAEFIPFLSLHLFVMLPGQRHLGAGLFCLWWGSRRVTQAFSPSNTDPHRKRFRVAACPHHSDLQYRHESIRLQIIVTGGISLPSRKIRGAMTSPEQPELYPQYCFHLSPTVGKWCHLRAADVVALSSHPGFGGEPGSFCGPASFD